MAYVRTVGDHALAAGRRSDMKDNTIKPLTMEEATADAEARNKRAEAGGYKVRYEAVDD